MKLMISQNKDGKGYYSKIINDFNGKHIEKYLSIQSKIDLEYGLYDVDGFLSVYEKKDGTPEFKFIILDATKIEGRKQPKKETNPFEEFGNNIETKSNVGEQIKITDEDLPF